MIKSIKTFTKTPVNTGVPVFPFDSLQLHDGELRDVADLLAVRGMREIERNENLSQIGAKWRKMGVIICQMFTQRFPRFTKNPRDGETTISKTFKMSIAL